MCSVSPITFSNLFIFVKERLRCLFVMEMSEHRFCDRCREPAQPSQLLKACRSQIAQRSKLLNESLPPSRSKAWNFFQDRPGHSSAAPLAVKGDGKAVRLITKGLKEI
jgi:hypothetical protein